MPRRIPASGSPRLPVGQIALYVLVAAAALAIATAARHLGTEAARPDSRSAGPQPSIERALATLAHEESLRIEPPAGDEAPIQSHKAGAPQFKPFTVAFDLTHADIRERREALEQAARDPLAELDVIAEALADPDDSIRARAEQLFAQALNARRR